MHFSLLNYTYTKKKDCSTRWVRTSAHCEQQQEESDAQRQWAAQPGHGRPLVSTKVTKSCKIKASNGSSVPRSNFKTQTNVQNLIACPRPHDPPAPSQRRFPLPTPTRPQSPRAAEPLRDHHTSSTAHSQPRSAPAALEVRPGWPLRPSLLRRPPPRLAPPLLRHEAESRGRCLRGEFAVYLN